MLSVRRCGTALTFGRGDAAKALVRVFIIYKSAFEITEYETSILVDFDGVLITAVSVSLIPNKTPVRNNHAPPCALVPCVLWLYLLLRAVVVY